MKSYIQFKKQILTDKKIHKAYNELKPEFDLVQMIIHKRIKLGLTQKELARKIGTKQSSISRFESGEYNPSVDFLKKIAAALEAKLKITIY